MYFDSHAHLTEDCFAQDFDSIVENMKEASVTGMMEIGFDLPSSEKAVRLAERFSWVHAAVGSHPDDAAQVDEARIAVYRELCKIPRVKAIGEIGLDYHYDFCPREIQLTAFERQLQLARELDLPVIIHSREAANDTLELLKKYRSCLNAAPRLPEVLAREMGDQLYIASFEDEAAMQAFRRDALARPRE